MSMFPTKYTAGARNTASERDRERKSMEPTYPASFHVLFETWRNNCVCTCETLLHNSLSMRAIKASSKVQIDGFSIFSWRAFFLFCDQKFLSRLSAKICDEFNGFALVHYWKWPKMCMNKKWCCTCNHELKLELWVKRFFVSLSLSLIREWNKVFFIRY